jgi:hypothetical protein
MTGAPEQVPVLITRANIQLATAAVSIAIEAQLVAEDPCDISYLLPSRHWC